MGKFKGTKWKWSVEQDKDFNTLHLIWSASEESILDNSTLIARTCYAPLSKYNAKLISKAPEMLSKLKQCISAIECCGFEKDIRGKIYKPEIGQAFIDSVNELIKQATTIDND